MLYLYLAISPVAMSSVFIREEDGVWKPIYYINQILKDAKTWYSKMEQVAFTLLILVRQLHSYFQAYSIMVLIDLSYTKFYKRSMPLRESLGW